MKHLRGLLCALLALCLLPAEAMGGLLPAGCPDAGTCGEKLTYAVEDGVLTIRGTGKMADYGDGYALPVPPWADCSFHAIVVEEGVASVGDYAFAGAPVTSVRLPETLEQIGGYAFENCSQITSIRLPEGLTYIGGRAFAGCTALADIHVPDGVTTLGTGFLEGTAAAQPSAWAQPEIGEANGLGLIPPECSYGYQRCVTREQIAALAVCMVGTAGVDLEAEVREDVFSDTDSWFVDRAAALGIVDGVGGGRFAPRETATREQIAAILCRAAACLEEALDRTLLNRSASLPETYADRGEASPWAVKELAALTDSGIMGGTSPATLSPRANATLEEAAVLMLRLFHRSFAVPAETPAGARCQIARADVASADYPLAEGIGAPNLGCGELTGEQLDGLIAAYNRACGLSAREEIPEVPVDTVRSFSCWVTLRMTDGSDISLCRRGVGEVRVWGEGRDMVLRSLEVYQLLGSVTAP